MGDGRNDTVYVDCLCTKEFDKSITIETADGTFSVPISMIRDGSDVTGEGDEGRLAIPRWLADDRGFDFDED